MFLENTRYLVIDDFATMRKIITKALFELGYSCVEEAENGREALDKLHQAQSRGEGFDVVISDSTMPEMSGLDLLRALRKDPALKTIPFLMITAESEEINIINAAKAGVSDCLVKPFSAQTLKEKLAKIHAKHFAPAPV